MKNILLLSVITILIVCPIAVSGSNLADPKPEELKLVTQLPRELPQRISGFAYDGEKFWAVIYHGRGLYATLNRSTLDWRISDSDEHHRSIRAVSGSFQSPAGICFINSSLWVAGSYGDSFGSINTQNWEVEHLFKGKQQDDNSASQSYSGIAFDGRHLWIAWHWFRYKLSVSETQLLLKVDPETGQVLARYPVLPGTRNDMTHGLAWDGTRIWHMKDSRLSSIEPATGAVIANYVLDQIKRPSALAWDGEALWVAEFDGKIWRLPF